MRLDFSLHYLPVPHLSALPLQGPSRTLDEIQSRNETRWAQGNTTREFQNRKETLRERLQAAVRPGERLSHESLFVIVRTEVGWQRLLLAIYLDDLGKDWLAAFDQRVAQGVLGHSGASWHASRRRQVTQFFFRHFDAIGALAVVSQGLRESYATANAEPNAAVRAWAVHREIVFDPEGPAIIASQAQPGETLKSLRERFALPIEGRFMERLRHLYLLESVERCGLGDEPPTLAQIKIAREETALGSPPLGALALQIMVRRVALEAGGKWPESWQKWIVRLGRDPRFGRASQEGSKWWGWATDAEFRLAQQGVTGKTLRFFIEFLKESLRGEEEGSQFERRSRFLLALFEANKIIDARLALPWCHLRHLEDDYRDPWGVAHLTAANDGTSLIALRCTDDVFILEGTHQCGLRAFHRTFPVVGFWDRTSDRYKDKELRIRRVDCPVFFPHDERGRWISNFFRALREKFHVEWSDVQI
jgi:hypothetical protein